MANDAARSRFIENGDASYLQWLLSQGTNYSCYLQYLEGQTDNKKVDTILNIIRMFVYAMIKPFQSSFFYWTLLLCIIHKFNFKKPVMKLILGHYVLRTIGDMIDQIGQLLNHYFATNADGTCQIDLSYTEQHPLKWFLTRQINMFFWYGGEIIGDWYPLLRTKAVARDTSSIKYVYIACGMFNLSKISLALFQFTLSPTSLYKNNIYDKDHVDRFYNGYWLMQCVIIICSLIYDLTVYLVLKNQLFNRTTNKEFGFLKKFRTISEFRICISALIGFFGLPIGLATIITKLYYCYAKNITDINFSFEDLRTVVANVQYFMIFIDQILLLRSKDESTVETFSGSNSYNNFSSNNYSYKNYNGSHNFSNNYSSVSQFKKSNLDSKSYFSNLSNINNSSNNNTLNNSSPTHGLMQYSNGSNFGMLSSRRVNDYSSDPEWNYLSR